eukprot:366448-Chlamydomonas_euryale.AAC.2
MDKVQSPTHRHLTYKIGGCWCAIATTTMRAAPGSLPCEEDILNGVCPPLGQRRERLPAQGDGPSPSLGMRPGAHPHMVSSNANCCVDRSRPS